ncbi:MAG: discoidin domain-containing protein [Oscillospiraceae bacterium]|nr:discoidin domain-containing protein [Oscillospiraceae bacterium]
MENNIEENTKEENTTAEIPMQETETKKTQTHIYKAVLMGFVSLILLIFFFAFAWNSPRLERGDDWKIIKKFESNTGNDFFSAMFDGDPRTRWTTVTPQTSGDYLMLEFYEAVDFNHIILEPGRYENDYPKGVLFISTSLDGDAYEGVKYIHADDNTDFIFESEPYRFIKFELTISDDKKAWSIVDFTFDKIESQPT